MYLIRLEIENFRGIRSASLDFDETIVLIGENDSGKTAILEAIEKVLSGNKEGFGFQFLPHEFYQQKVDGQYRIEGPIRISLTFRERTPDEWSFMKDNEMGIYFKDDRYKCQELTITVRAIPSEGPAVPTWEINIPGSETSHLDNDPAVLEWIRRMNPVFRIKGGMVTGTVQNDQIQASSQPSDHINIETQINTIRGHFENLLKGTTPDVHAEIKAGYQAAMNYLDEASSFFQPDGFQEQKIILEILGKHKKPYQTGSKRIQLHHGSAAEMIGLLLFSAAMLQSGSLSADPSSEPIFIIEDPEANLHPMTLESIRLLIERLKFQKIITTQSGDFLAGFPIHDVRRITRQNGYVAQYKTDPATLGSEDLRRLSYHIRMKRGAATFARCWLLVEGETEVWLLPHLARLCGFELAMEGITCVEFAQCGISPLIKTARLLGIEWHLLADGDAAGKAYTETAKHFANQAGDEHSQRFTRFREKDIEHHMFFNGYAGVYYEYSGFPQHAPQSVHPGKVIGRAIHRNSKPFMAIAVVEAIAREGSPGVPPVIKKMIQTCINLAKGYK
jgi:putative ATP-dependent endonuclease of OLD family